MHRRSAAQANDGTDLDSNVSSSQGSITTSTIYKSGRKSLAASVADLHDDTRSKFFPMITLLMELSYNFVKGSSEVYSVYALAGYTSTLAQIDAIDLMTKYRYLGALIVLPLGIVCDSYVGTYYPLIFSLCVLVGLMGLHAVISLPSMYLATDAKLWMAQATFSIFTIFYVVEPLKLVAFSRAIMEANYFRQPRHFYALLACSINLGIGVGGTVLYLSLRSRYALCTVMFANFGLTMMYTAFFVVARKEFMSDQSKKTTDNMGVIEKALAAILCSAFKYFDQRVCRSLIFRESSDDEGDFRCFRFSNDTRKNGRAIVGIVLVTVPLVAAFGLYVIVEALYYMQMSMFWYYPNDPFPLLALKSYMFLLLFPLMELYIGPSLRKWSRTEASRLLTMVGLGCICVSLSLCWAFAVHKIVRDGNEFWYTFPDGTGHIAITNCLNDHLYYRSQFVNYILDGDDGWSTLPPFQTINILNVPMNSSPFHFEFTNTKLSLYDEYFLPFEQGQSTWYLILPTGVFSFPPWCYRRSQKSVALSTGFYGPAKICVVCALSVCNGYGHFYGGREGTEFSTQVPLLSLTGRGKNEPIAADKISVRLTGNFEIAAIFGGVFYIGSLMNATFERTSTYMLIVYEGLNNTSWENDSWVVADRLELIDDSSDLIKTSLMKTSPRNTYYVEWMYPTVFFHALGEVTYQVSLWMFLYMQSTYEIRTTIFCFVQILCIPAYAYLYTKGPLSLRNMKPMDYFYLSAANFLFVIFYFFCILFFIHKLFKVKPVQRGSFELAQRRKSAMPVFSEEGKGE